MSDCDWQGLHFLESKYRKNGRYSGSRYNSLRYTFYSIVNSSVHVDQGNCAAAVIYLIYTIS